VPSSAVRESRPKTRSTVHVFFLRSFFVDCRRRSASSCALAAKTSAVASLNSRPCSTSGRISSTHSLGIHSTRLLPLAMNVSDHMGCPSPPLAHQQVGVPQRRCVRASEPGKASGGICRPRSNTYLRWRKREATSPLASYHFTACIIACSHPLSSAFSRWGNLRNARRRDLQSLHGITALSRNSCPPVLTRTAPITLRGGEFDLGQEVRFNTQLSDLRGNRDLE